MCVYLCHCLRVEQPFFFVFLCSARERRDSSAEWVRISLSRGGYVLYASEVSSVRKRREFPRLRKPLMQPALVLPRRCKDKAVGEDS